MESKKEKKMGGSFDAEITPVQPCSDEDWKVERAWSRWRRMGGLRNRKLEGEREREEKIKRFGLTRE